MRFAPASLRSDGSRARSRLALRYGCAPARTRTLDAELPAAGIELSLRQRAVLELVPQHRQLVERIELAGRGRRGGSRGRGRRGDVLLRRCLVGASVEQ